MLEEESTLQRLQAAEDTIQQQRETVPPPPPLYGFTSMPSCKYILHPPAGE